MVSFRERDRVAGRITRINADFARAAVMARDGKEKPRVTRIYADQADAGEFRGGR
jgi:hypothetical protein